MRPPFRLVLAGALVFTMAVVVPSGHGVAPVRAQAAAQAPAPAVAPTEEWAKTQHTLKHGSQSIPYEASAGGQRAIHAAGAVSDGRQQRDDAASE